MRFLLRWTLRLAATLVLALAAYSAYALWAWRDLPVESLEGRYGGPDLAVASIDGVPVRYRLRGDGPALVLIHSHFLDMGMWDAWTEQLAPHFTVLRFDLAGHGLTGPDPSGRYDVERDVELLAGLLDELGVASARIVGSSLGGNVAFTFSARHPERTEALVLINSGGLKRQSSRSGREMPGWADAVFRLVPPAALHRFLRWMAADKRAVDAALEERFVAMFRRVGNRPAELARLRQFETGDPDPLLAAIRAPTLVLWGADNPQLPAALAEEFAKRLSGAASVETRLYPGAGHLLPLERPLDSARDTLAFLQEQAAP